MYLQKVRFYLGKRMYKSLVIRWGLMSAYAYFRPGSNVICNHHLVAYKQNDSKDGIFVPHDVGHGVALKYGVS